MEKIKPPKEEEGASSWAKDQMEESPTLLPDLKFHDLVFGHELGGGAFGVVRYARLIDRTKTRSHWAEYAVKIISTEKIIEMGYEPSVQREIAVLRMLSHPCITRLISSFRFREGVYLVLEYASKGDLHTLLKKNGSIDHNSARFIIGEVTAALNAIHDMDFVYADLKPENIVITETGHVKLTDFGGTRPVSETAKAMITASASNVLRNMRDGDWKSMKTSGSKFDMDDGVSDDDVMKNGEYDPNADDRVEGTTAYLPPEVVLGAVPTKAADSWALGCVLYQCLSGRPPMLESDDSKTKSKIVSFDSNTGPTDDESVLFLDSHATHIERNARDLIIQLLNRVQTSRPSMRQVADHGFFTDAGVSIWTLHKEAAHPIEIGDVEAVVDAHWTRRQLSTIWAPQPQTYDVSAEHAGSSHGQSTIVSTRSEPIQEGEERTAFFSKANLLPSLFSASQFVPLPPRREITEA
jgi:serine/threonine protein kinase